MPLEAAAWLLSVIASDPASRKERSATLKRFGKLVTEPASTAQFTSSYADGSHLLLHSARRTDAIILEALINSNPQSDLVPKVVKGLLAHRTMGRWRNTQENAFVLLSLDRYFEVFEAEEPYFVAPPGSARTSPASTTSRGAAPSTTTSRSPWKSLIRRKNS